MKTNNKKIRFVSALVTLGTLVPLAASATSCASTAQNVSTETKTNDSSVVTNGPVKATYVTITFDGNGGTLEGQKIIKTRSGKLFGQIAHPKATKTDWQFDGWYDDASAGSKIEDSTPLTTNLTIYAHWKQETTYKTLTFDQGSADALYGDLNVEISSGGQTLADLNKPRAVLAGRDFKCWKYNNQELTNESICTYAFFNTLPYTLTPVFYEPKVYDIEIVDDSDILVEDYYSNHDALPVQYQSDLNIKVHGQEGAVVDEDDITWTIESGNSIQLDTGGKGIITPVPGKTGPTTIKATIENDDGSTAEATKIIEPVTPDKVFKDKVLIEDTNAGETRWWFANLDDLCNPETTQFTKTEATNREHPDETIVQKNQLDTVLHVGTEDGIIPNSFLARCDIFGKTKGKVILNDNITTIGDDFMSNLYQFNQTLTLPNSVTSIGENFMSECSIFDNGGEEAFALPSNIQFIGKYFMYDCDLFDCQITLPNTLRYVGDSFMSLCQSFNHLTVNCDPMYIMDIFEVDTLANLTTDVPDPTERVRITIDGNFDDEFKAKFIELTPPAEEEGHVYLYRLYA